MAGLPKLGVRGLGRFRGKLRERIERAREVRTYPKFRIREPHYFITLPSLRDPTKVNLTYPLLEPFVSARISWNATEKQLRYEVIEPLLSAPEQETYHQIAAELTELIDVKISATKNREEAIAYLEGKIADVLDDLGITIETGSYMKILYAIFRDFVGLNEIEPLMNDPYIEDIGCSGMDTQIYVTHRKFGTIATNISFTDFDALSNFVIKLSERCGRYISYATPLLDGTLPDGSRIQASLAKDVTTKGPTFSIRRFRKNPFSPIDVVNFKTCSPGLMAYLWFLIESSASILVAGGVSTGKTTFLNTLGMFIPFERKVVSIEDVREINIPHENWIPATSRSGFGIPDASGRRYGEVQLFDLLKESFRMKPDYVIVGEVRGEEAYVLFQGMASGNPSLGTIHSGSVEDVMKRLQTPPIELSPSLIEALDVLIVMVNAWEKGKSARRVKEVVEIESMDAQTGKAHTTKTFAWIPSSDDFKDATSQSVLLRKLSFERGIPYESIRDELDQRARIIKWMQKFGLVQFDEVCPLINLYYKDPETVRGWVAKGIPPHRVKKEADRVWESVTGLRIAKETL